MPQLTESRDETSWHRTFNVIYKTSRCLVETSSPAIKNPRTQNYFQLKKLKQYILCADNKKRFMKKKK